jgi:glc operon protein GlcG
MNRTRRILDLPGAEAVMHAAENTARDKGYRVVTAVVDPWGHLLRLTRTDGAQIASDRVAIDKARTAAIFVRPSREIEEQVSGGRLGALSLHGAVALTGGIPLAVEGQVVGAVGTSGETRDEDEAVSLAGAGADFTTSEVPALSYAVARRAAEAAGAEAASRGVAPVIAVATPAAGRCTCTGPMPHRSPVSPSPPTRHAPRPCSAGPARTSRRRRPADGRPPSISRARSPSRAGSPSCRTATSWAPSE